MLTVDTVEKFLEIVRGERAKHSSYRVIQINGDDRFPQDPARNLLFGLSVITAGCVKLTLNSRDWTVKAGQLIAFCPGSIVTFHETSADLECPTLLFDSHFLSEKINDTSFFSALPIFQYGADPVLTITEPVGRKLEALVNTLKLHYQDLASTNIDTIRYIILAILSDIGYACVARQKVDAIQPNRATKIADQYLRLVSQQYVHSRIISDYAKQLTVSTKHLSETVKEVTGRPAMFWIDLMLVHEAQIMLRQTENTVSQISNALGFSDQSAFGKFFKQRLKVSPGHYRKNHTSLSLIS